MEFVDGSIQGKNNMDDAAMSVLDWPDMLADTYECTLMYDHNRAPSMELLLIFYKYYWGRRRGSASVGSRI